MGKLTKASIDALVAPASGQAFLWDPELRGFGVRVTSGGTKTYVLQYRNEEGRSRRIGLGRYGVLTPNEARTAAKKKLGAVAGGEDPAQEKKERRAAPTVAEICDWYLEEAVSGRLLGRRNRPIKASTLYMDKSRIDRHIKPLIGTRQIAKLSGADISALRRTSLPDVLRRIVVPVEGANRRVVRAPRLGRSQLCIRSLNMQSDCISSKQIPLLVFVGSLAISASGA